MASGYNSVDDVAKAKAMRRLSSAPSRDRNTTMGRSNSLKYIGEKSLSMRPGVEKTPEDAATIAASLRANNNFKKFIQLDEEQIQTLTTTAWKEVVVPGRCIMKEGSMNNAVFFIVTEGSFEVTSSYEFEVVDTDGMSFLTRPEAVFKNSSSATDPAWARSFSPGGAREVVRTTRMVGKNSSFGDSSMLYGTPRWATVTAVEESVVWVISQANFKIVQSQAARGSASFFKSEAEERLIAEALQVNANLQRLTPLHSAHIKQLTDIAWKETLDEGQIFMREGDMNADAFYILAEGSVQVESSEPFDLVEQDGSSFINVDRAVNTSGGVVAAASETTGQGATPTSYQCGRGLCIGELSMLYCAPRFTTLTALEKSVVFAIDRSSFQMVQMKAAEDDFNERVRHLDQLDVMATFSKEDKGKVAGYMELIRFVKGQTLVNEGSASTNFYVLTKGEFSVSSAGQSSKPIEAGKGVVHYFGEQFNERSPVSETVTVESATASALVLSLDTFHKVWERLVATATPGFTRYATSVTKVGRDDEVALKNISRLRLIGRTNLGPVELVAHRDELYVMKTMNRGLIQQRGLRQSVARERRLWMEMISPFITRCFAAFSEEQNLYLLLEPAIGGDLSDVYRRCGFYGQEAPAKYYAAGLVLGLNHLHKRRIVYRNLKPENVLLSPQGQPKLTDMSLAKLVVGHTFTTCGVPTYMAPEVLVGVGHNRAVDWWSMGVLIFELLAGKNPFDSNTPMRIYSRVMHGIGRVDFPEACRGTVESLIRGLLAPEVICRLGMGQGGVADIKSHEWFASIDWQAVLEQKLEVPYVPSWPHDPQTWSNLPPQELDDCLSYFMSDKSLLPHPVEYKEDASGWDAEFITPGC